MKQVSFLKLLLLGILLPFLAQPGMAQIPPLPQICDFTVGPGASTCSFNFTPMIAHVDGYLIENLWSFGDGSTSDVANPVHSYPSVAFGGGSQVYTVTHQVIVRNPFTLALYPGGPFICTQTVTVYPASSCQLCPPLAEIPSLFDYHVTGCSVSFHANLQNAQQYTWSFGDGTFGLGQDVTHLYNGNGTYSVSLGASNGPISYRCVRTVKVDCDRPNSEYNQVVSGGSCGCFGLDLFPVEQSAGATYGWWVNEVLVATGPHPNLFPHGIDVCAIQQSGGTIKVTLVVQLNGESSLPTSHTINLNGITAAIYIGTPGATTNLSDYESVLPGNAYCGSCKVKVCGIVTVDKPFDFCGAEVEVNAGNCGFDVPTGQTLRLTGGARLHGCQCIWRGIKMLPQSTVVVLDKSIIEDAAYGIDVQDNLSFNPVELILNDGIFQNNYIGIRVTGRANFTVFTNNHFTTLSSPVPPLWPDCMPIIPGSFSRNIGYTGIFIDHQGTTLTLPSDNNGNNFSNLALGIQSLNGTLNLDHTATFENINTCNDYQANNGGTAIYFRNDASFTANGNDFRGVKTGMWGETNITTDLHITGNTMDAGTPSVARGIQLTANQPGKMTGDVTNNTIRVNNAVSCLSPEGAFGVAFYDNTTGNNSLSIQDNTVTLDCTVSPTTGLLVKGLGVVNLPNVVEVDVENNTVNGTKAAFGIELVTCKMVAVHRCTLNLENSNFMVGIELNGAENNRICSNTINNTGTNKVGLSADDARYNDIVNNKFFLTNTGASFAGDCGGSVIGCNEFHGPQNIGLLYKTAATVTGSQVNTGNAWYPQTWNSGQKAWINPANTDFPGNQYVVPQAPSPYNPDNVQQNGSGTFWFDASQPIDPPNCSGLYDCGGYNRPASDRNAASDTAPTSNRHMAVNLSFQVVPNPNYGACTVLLDKATGAGATLRIVSSSGSLIQTYSISAEQTSYTVADLPSGVYFFTIATKDLVSEPKKVIIF